MDFGVILPTYLPGSTVDGIAETARRAEHLGYRSVWTTDHVLMPTAQAGPYATIFEAVTLVGYLAAITSRIELGISVIVVPQRHPVVLAKELATLDQLAGGRLQAGVGAGWCEGEFAFLGAADTFERRGAVLNESMRLMRALWTDPSQPFEGRYFAYRDAAFGPPPKQAGGPPFWVGGASEAALRRTARLAETWHPVGIAPAAVREGLATLRILAPEVGRPVPTVAPRLTIAFDDPLSSITGPTLRPSSAVQGSSQTVLEAMRAYAEAGCQQVICGFGGGAAGPVIQRMERFASEVMPGLA